MKTNPNQNGKEVHPFSINGEQWFFPIRDVELIENAVTLRWTPNAAINHVGACGQ